MPTLRLPGLLTGIDTNSLIAQLMAIERRRLYMYQERKGVWEERKSALSSLEMSLGTLRTTLRGLSDADELRAFSAASSDKDILTAEASYNAFEGSHTVVINRLANAERWVQTGGLEYVEDFVGEGTFIYSYNHKETSITTTAETTLEDFVGLINNDANNPGVTASLLHYNDAYHLVLNGNEAGTDYKISVNNSTTEVWKSDSKLTKDNDNATLSTKITELDQFIGTLGASDTITIEGENKAGSDLASVTLDVTENTKIGHLINEINDAFDGTAKAVFENGKIVLTSDYCGSNDMTITLTYNGTHATDPASLDLSMVATDGGTPGTLTNFTASDFTESQSAQDSKIRVDGFPSSTEVPEEQTLTPDFNPTGGTYTLTYKGQTTATINHSDPLATIKSRLEALSTVSENDITVGGGANGLADGAVTFTFRDTAGDVPMISIDFSGLTGPTAACPIVETEKGQDGYISRSSNTVGDVISGVTLHLHDTTEASGEDVTLTRDIQSVKSKLSSMVSAYNAAVTYIKERTGYNEELKTAGVLMGDYIVSTISSQLLMPLISRTSGFIEDIDTFLLPGQIGLELDKDGVLSLDTNVFDEAIAEDYMDVLAIIGADKTGSSDSSDIEFYGAHSDYTTAGSYRVKVEYSGGTIDKAWIKLSSEGDSKYREATISGNVITGNSTFDDNGDTVYPENGLQVTVPTTGSSTIYATIRVKQGFTGAIEDAIDRMLKASSGTIQIGQKHVDDIIENIEERIEAEEYRLTRKEDRLIARFARLEKTLALIQQQMSILGFGIFM